jgi:pimeloyl-ACP methyl ester carboxylesterase
MGSGPDVPQELQGKTIISYRGTDFTPDTDYATDKIEGWPLGGGNFLHDQTRLAADFLDAVQADGAPKSVILTGHSLGGGLAGYLSRHRGHLANAVPARGVVTMERLAA